MCLQFKEYSTHLEHHLRDVSLRSADFVAKQQAYGEALAAFGAQAANMSKYEDSTAASAFMDLQASATSVANMHADVTKHVQRFAIPQLNRLLRWQHVLLFQLSDVMFR